MFSQQFVSTPVPTFFFCLDTADGTSVTADGASVTADGTSVTADGTYVTADGTSVTAVNVSGKPAGKKNETTKQSKTKQKTHIKNTYTQTQHIELKFPQHSKTTPKTESTAKTAKTE